MLIILIISILIAWLYWSISIVKWKLWAYSKVRNIKAVDEAALKATLVWPPRSIMTKTEIWSTQDNQLFNDLKSQYALEVELQEQEDSKKTKQTS